MNNNKEFQPSKLNTTTQKKPLNIISKQKYADTRSFRLDETSWSDLLAIVERLNVNSRHKVNLTKVIRALIHLGKNTNDEKLINSLKETLF